jgi:hypothetical protein
LGGGSTGGRLMVDLPCTVRGLWPRGQPPAAPGLPHCTRVGS